MNAEPRWVQNELCRVARDVDIEAEHSTGDLASWLEQYAANVRTHADALTPTVHALEAGRWP